MSNGQMDVGEKFSLLSLSEDFPSGTRSKLPFAGKII